MNDGGDADKRRGQIILIVGYMRVLQYHPKRETDDIGPSTIFVKALCSFLKILIRSCNFARTVCCSQNACISLSAARESESRRLVANR